jgi:hypothetical protein
VFVAVDVGACVLLVPTHKIILLLTVYLRKKWGDCEPSCIPAAMLGGTCWYLLVSVLNLREGNVTCHRFALLKLSKSLIPFDSKYYLVVISLSRLILKRGYRGIYPGFHCKCSGLLQVEAGYPETCGM